MSLNPPSTPPKKKHGPEAKTPRKAAFFSAYENRRRDGKTATQIYQEHGIPPRTGQNWLKKFKILGSPAIRRIRKLSTNLGPPCKISEETCKYLVSTDNPVRGHKKPYQIAYHHLDIH